MLTTRHRTFGYLALVGLLAVLAADGWADEEGLRQQLVDSVFTAPPGPSAIKLEVWTDKPAGEPSQPGEQVALHVRAEQDAWLTLIEKMGGSVRFWGLSTEEASLGFLRGRKSYKLCDDARLCPETEKSPGKIVLAVTERPFDPGWPQALEGDRRARGWIPCPVGGDLKMYISQAEKITQLTKDPGFNRVVITLKDKDGKPLGLRVRWADKATNARGLQSKPADKAPKLKPKTLPLQQSGGAETVSGVQGAK